MYTLIAWEITNRSEQNVIGLLVNNQMGNKKAELPRPKCFHYGIISTEMLKKESPTEYARLKNNLRLIALL